jgi:predicted nucleic acid-binding protein
MFQTLKELPSRVILDTNIVLNAAFVEGSSSRHSIEQLNKLRYYPVIDQAIADEAIRVLVRLRRELNLAYDPLKIFRDYLAESKILTLPSAPLIQCRPINKADRHVIGAACQYGAWVLTGDIKLAGQCHGFHVATRLPWDVIFESYLGDDLTPPVHYVFQIAGVSSRTGSIFARIVTGGWGGACTGGHYTVCDVQNIGRLYYDSSTSEWVFSTVLSAEARLKCALSGNQEWLLSVSFDVATSGAGGLTLRAAQPHGDSAQSNVSFRGAFPGIGPGQITFGHTIHHNDHWNGGIKRVVLRPVSIDAKGWRALVTVPEAAPDPASSNILEAALRRVKISPSRIVVPSEILFHSYWL